MENTCIKVLDMEHSKKVVAYYKSLGIDTGEVIGGCVGRYYGVHNGNFAWSFNPMGSKIIELPTENTELTFPRKMKVCNKENGDYQTRIVIHDLGCRIRNRYVAVNAINESDYINEHYNIQTTSWDFAKEIETIELTLDDIAKKFEVKPEQIKIIK